MDCIKKKDYEQEAEIAELHKSEILAVYRYLDIFFRK